MERVGKRARVILGDETGIVKAFLFNNESLEEGKSVVLFKAHAPVVKEHVEVQLMDRGRVEAARRDIKEVSKDHDVSEKEWVEAS